VCTILPRLLKFFIGHLVLPLYLVHKLPESLVDWGPILLPIHPGPVAGDCRLLLLRFDRKSGQNLPKSGAYLGKREPGRKIHGPQEKGTDNGPR